MKDKSELFKNLNLINKHNDYNKKLIMSLGKTFGERGLASSTPNSIFQNISPLDGLTDMELGLFVTSLYNSKDLDKEAKETIKPSDYFTPSEIDIIDNFKIEKKILRELVFESIDKVHNSDFEWLCGWWSFEDMYDAHLANLTSYNIKTQREATYKRTQTGEILILPTINPIAVREIGELAYNDKFKPNLITINIRLIKGKTPNIKHDERSRKLIITPEYDFTKPNTTFADIIDGQHRFSGAISGVEKRRKEGKKTKGGLFVYIMCATEDEANAIIAKEAKRNEISTEHTKSIENTDYNKIVSMINEDKNKKNNILYNEVAKTYKELEATEKLTTNEFLTYAIKHTGLDISNSYKMKIEIPEILEIMNDICQTIIQEKFSNDIEKIKKETELFKHGMFAGYFVLATKIKTGNCENKINDIVDSLILRNDKLKEFNLGTKNPKLNKLCEFIETII
ncbi:hypothetical protein [Clostridium tagluense]|uniref:DGQHR domain-containing protein n=1 Tax=Clostridium tagluense TaxID=360422 RepID=A0A401UTK9_9CLOT|nr:hypothetical protein [Clostridium tagluense]GCD12877.1 hypothetical protein Ctaglu_45000 [Clostridium tagluense]